MPLTLADYRNRLQHALGGEVSDLLDQDALINEAGRAFVDAHTWGFMQRPPTDLDFTISVGYVNLPSDFASLIAIDITADNLNAFQLVDYSEFAKYEAVSYVGTPGGVFGTIVYPGQTSVTAAAGVPRLLLYPTPTSTISGALRIFYRAGWTELTNDADVPNFPTYCESVFTEFVRAFAFGSEEPDQGTVFDRVDRIIVSGMFDRLKNRADMAQHDYGPERNGAIGDALGIDFISQTPSAPS
jgi:hypothetical protein